MLNKYYFISTIIALAMVSLFGFNSSKKISSASDFSIANRSLSSKQVAGSILATIVGGASTIGTAELAFNQGINGIWFTLGASIACLFLALFIAGPMRSSKVETISEFMVKYYGEESGIIISVLTSIAIFIHINGQVLSSVAILTSMFLINQNIAVAITMMLIMSYIFFGGFWGTSIIGVLKTLLLYTTLIISSILILRSTSGIRGFVGNFDYNPWLNLFSDGILEGVAQGFSLVVGIATTQTYLQALFSGKSVKESKKGAYLSALLIPPIGIMCAMIGMFMRVQYPMILSKQALPLFILNYMDPILGGIMIATLIISVVGTGAGLTLGISTMISRDIYKVKIRPLADDAEQLLVLRISVVIITTLSMIIVYTNLDSLILKWGFLSMALRGTVVFVPLIFAIIFKERVNKKAGILSMVVCPVLTIFLSVYKISAIPPLYIGLIMSILIYFIYYLRDKKSAYK